MVHNFIENRKWEFVNLKEKKPINPMICLAPCEPLLSIKFEKEDGQTGIKKSLK